MNVPVSGVISVFVRMGSLLAVDLEGESVLGLVDAILKFRRPC